MITLKKNDKIIIIAAVAVIIIAGVGIAAYSPEEPKDIAKPIMGNNYMITWKNAIGNEIGISGFAPKNSVKTDSFTISEKNIKTITVNMSWVDDLTFLLGRFGLDTLQLKITTPDGEEFSDRATSEKRTKQGKISIMIPVNSYPPSKDSIIANSSDEAENIIESKFSMDKFTDEEFKIDVSCTIGELRILRKIREKGNNFNIDISYDYYYPDLKKDMSDNNHDDDMFNDLEEENYKPPFLSMIIGTGCGRYI